MDSRDQKDRSRRAHLEAVLNGDWIGQLKEKKLYWHIQYAALQGYDEAQLKSYAAKILTELLVPGTCLQLSCL